MIEIGKQLPLPNLEKLNCAEIAIRTKGEEGFIAYFDFQEDYCLDSKKVADGLGKLTEQQSPSSLSFSGWLGFFGYEFLSANLGLTLQSSRDLEVPDGWFGRPQSIIHILPNQTKIESTLPEREQQIAHILEFSDLFDLNQVKFATSSQKCNLSYPEYEKIFAGARKAILDGESYQIKISQRY